MHRWCHLPALFGFAVCSGIARGGEAVPGGLPSFYPTDGIPADFVDHFFNVPLASRIVVDGEYLGEAMILLAKDHRVQLLHFTDTFASNASGATRESIAMALTTWSPLGSCEKRTCNQTFRRIAFDNLSSTLELVRWDDVRATPADEARLAPPPATGAIISQRINMVRGVDGNTTGRYWIDLLGSAAGWTFNASAQHERTALPADPQTRARATGTRVQNAYAQREFKRHFVRAGRFFPDALGLYQSAGMAGGRADTMTGVMFGSSDSLRMHTETASIYPIYVTATRQAVVEVYRGDTLIHTQQVVPGLQPVDTRPLPGGIYTVDIRVIEDGNLTSSTSHLVYKPTLWLDTSRRWRYNVIAGRTLETFARDGRRRRPEPAIGAAINLLVHPRMILGASATSSRSNHTAGLSLDSEINTWVNVHTALYSESSRWRGLDTQLLFRLPRGSMVVGYSDGRRKNRTPWHDSSRLERRWSVASNMRVDERTQLTGRVARDRGDSPGAAFDVSATRDIGGRTSRSSVRLSVFNRPRLVNTRRRRDRGFELAFNLALDRPASAWTASFGRSAGEEPSRDTHATLQYVRQGAAQRPRWIASVTRDSHGLGGNAGYFFDNAYARGDIFAQRSSIEGDATGGLNLENAVALGDGHVTASGDAAVQFSRALMAVDVAGDADSIRVRATDRLTTGAVLKPGRNLLALAPYAAGAINFDIDGDGGSALLDQRSMTYNVAPGTVKYTRIHAVRTITALGRLVDATGHPLPGALVVNKAGRAVTEASGVFSLELATNDPALVVTLGGDAACRIDHPDGESSAADHLTLLGDVVCALPGP